MSGIVYLFITPRVSFVLRIADHDRENPNAPMSNMYVNNTLDESGENFLSITIISSSDKYTSRSHESSIKVNIRQKSFFILKVMIVRNGSAFMCFLIPI
jgi:hypothetical protein